MTFQSYFHVSFHDEHVLLPAIALSSFWTFLVACVLVTSICLFERFLTFLIDKQWSPRFFRRSKVMLAFWRTCIYSANTFLRLCYMLAAMTFHLGLVFTIVLSLSIAQFFIEIHKISTSTTREALSRNSRGHESSTLQPLLSERDELQDSYPPTQTKKTRPRSKSKPDDIFIHPAQSNIARADAAAMELGLTGETERVRAYKSSKSSPAWEIGKGRAMARELLLGNKKLHPNKLSHEKFSVDETY